MIRYAFGMIRYAFGMIRYAFGMSLEAYRLFFEKFRMPSLSLLNKIQQGGVDASKALKTLYQKGSFSRDCILMIDEMYLEKSARYQSGEYKGVDEKSDNIDNFIEIGL